MSERRFVMFEGKTVQALADRVEQLATDLRATQARCDQLQQELSQRDAELRRMHADQLEEELPRREVELRRVRADQLVLGRRLDEAVAQSGKAVTGLLARMNQLGEEDATGASLRRPA